MFYLLSRIHRLIGLKLFQKEKICHIRSSTNFVSPAANGYAAWMAFLKKMVHGISVQ